MRGKICCLPWTLFLLSIQPLLGPHPILVMRRIVILSSMTRLTNGQLGDKLVATALPSSTTSPNLDNDNGKPGNKTNLSTFPVEDWKHSKELIKEGNRNMLLYKIFYRLLQPPALTTLVPLLGFQFQSSMDQDIFVPIFRNWSIFPKIPTLFLATQCILRKHELSNNPPHGTKGNEIFWEFDAITENEVIIWDAKSAPQTLLSTDRDHTEAYKGKRPFFKDGVTSHYDQAKFVVRLESPWPTSGCLIFYKYTYDGSEETTLLLVSDKHSSQEIINMRNDPDSITDLHLFLVSPTLFSSNPPKYKLHTIEELIRLLFISGAGSIFVDLYRNLEEMAYTFGFIWNKMQQRQQKQPFSPKTDPDRTGSTALPHRSYSINSDNLFCLPTGELLHPLIRNFLAEPQIRASVHFKLNTSPFERPY